MMLKSVTTISLSQHGGSEKYIPASSSRTGKSAIGLENLKHIRERITVGRKQRAKHSGWAFFQLQEFVRYKARLAGVPVVMVDARNSSRECSKCHCVSKRNRKTQSEFCCISCGHIEHADLNASKIISQRAAPSVGPSRSVSSSKVVALSTASRRASPGGY